MAVDFGGRARGESAASRTLRVLQVLPSDGAVGPAYGVAFGARLYAAADRADPMGVYTCVHDGPIEFRSKPEKNARFTNQDQAAAQTESVWDMPPPSRDSQRPEPLRRGGRIVAEQVKDGWIRAAGGAQDRWCPLNDPEQSDVAILERLPSSCRTPRVPQGWEVLRLQDCSQDVLMKVIGGFEWGGDAVAVHDVAAGRFVRIGTRKHSRAGDQLGEAHGISVFSDGSIGATGCAVLVTRRLVGVSWGSDTFDALGLLQDSGYLDTAAERIEFPTIEDLELECRDSIQNVLVAELRGWFATPPPGPSQLVDAATQDASALRRLWAARLRDRRYRILHECFKQLPSGPGVAVSGEAEGTVAWSSTSAAVPDAVVEEEDDDPMQLWVKVALSTVLELATVMPLKPVHPSFNNLERLISRAARTLASARPLSLHGRGPSQALMGEVVRSLDPLMEATPELGPACNGLLLAFATATGSSFLAARVAHGLLRGTSDAVARACIPGVRTFWQLGSILHFEVRDTPVKGALKPEESRRPWQFQALEHVGIVPSKVDCQVRSCLTLPFGEIPPGGVYWEVEVNSADARALSLGVWLAHAQHFVGCSLADGAAVGLPGARATLAEELPTVQAGSVFGLLLTDEEVTVSCDGQPFSCVGFREMTRSAGAEAAIFIGQGKHTQFQLNIGQRKLKYMPQGPCDCPPRPTPIVWGHAVVAAGAGCGRTAGGGQAGTPFAPFVKEPETARGVATVLLGALERNASASVATDGGGSYRFGETHRMQLEPDGMQVKRVNENAWAVVDCELSGADEAEWCFQNIEDLNNDEGTCYGVTTKPPQNSYDRDGWIVIRAYNAHFYVSGSDYNVRTGIQKIHPGSKVHFRLCLAEGLLYAWVNDNPPVEMLRDPSVFVGRTWFPGCFVYGSRATVRLVSCWKSRTLRRPSSFGLEYSPRAVEMWVCILEDVVRGLADAPKGSAGAAEADVAAAQALRVLVAQMQAAKVPWSAFGGVRERLKAQLQVLIIDRRDDPALAQSQVLSCLLVEGLGVGDLWGGPEEVLGIFLRIRGTDSRVEQTLAEFLLEQQQVCAMSPALVDELVSVAAQDALGGQILLRLVTSAFTDSAEQFIGLARGVLVQAAVGAEAEVARGSAPEGNVPVSSDANQCTSAPRVGYLKPENTRLADEPETIQLAIVPEDESCDQPESEVTTSASASLAQQLHPEGMPAKPPDVQVMLQASEAGKPTFFSAELLPVVAMLLGALPHREADILPKVLPLLELAAKVRDYALRGVLDEGDHRSNKVDAALPQHMADIVEGLTTFTCSVAALMLRVVEASPFPLSLPDGIEVRSSAAGSNKEPRDKVEILALAEEAVQAAVALCGGGEATASDAPDGVEKVATADEKTLGVEEPLPTVVSEILDATGSGENLIRGLHSQTSPEAADIGQVQRALFAAVVYFSGPTAWSAATSDPEGTDMQKAWQLTQQLYQSRPADVSKSSAAHSNEGSAQEAADSEETIASRIVWVVRSVLYPRDDDIVPGGTAAADGEAKTFQFTPATRTRAAADVSKQTGSSLFDTSKMLAQVLEADCNDEALTSAAAGHRDSAAWRLLALRLLRGLLMQCPQRGFCSASALLPAVQDALEEMLKQPGNGIQYSGFLHRRKVLRELVSFLREVHRQSTSGPADALALGVGMLCVPLSRSELEELLEGHLQALATDCLDGLARPGKFQLAHIAAMVLRTYMVVPGHARGSPMLADLFARLAKAFGAQACSQKAIGDADGPVLGPPTPAPEATDPLMIDWDFGALGRLCPRRLNEEVFPAPAASESRISRYNDQYYCTVRHARLVDSGRVAIEFEVIGDGSLGVLQQPTASRLSWEGGSASPSSHEYTFMDLNSHGAGTLFFDNVPSGVALQFTYGTGGYSSIAVTFSQDSAISSLDELPGEFAQDITLRCPSGVDPLRFDAASPVVALSAANKQDPPWVEDHGLASCTTSLMLLRPVVDLCALTVPDIAEHILQLAVSAPPLPGALAMHLIRGLEIRDEQLSRWAPAFFRRLGDLASLTFNSKSWESPKRCGSLALSAFLVRELQVYTSAMRPMVLRTFRSLLLKVAGSATEALEGSHVHAGPEDADAQLAGDASNMATGEPEKGEERSPSSSSSSPKPAQSDSVEPSWASAALLLVGGCWRSPVLQLQTVDVPFGRGLVVDTQQDHIKVLSLDPVDGTPPMQRVRFADLPVPAEGQHAAATRSISAKATLGWGDDVVRLLLQVAKASMHEKLQDGVSMDHLKALAAVFPSSPQWDAGLVRGVVKELSSLVQKGLSESVHEPLELLEHRLLLLQLASSAVSSPSGGPDTGDGSATPSPTSPTGTAGAARGASTRIISAVPAVSLNMESIVVETLNLSGWWQGKYKLGMGRNTWYKVKWQVRASLQFEVGGTLVVTAVWPQFNGEERPGSSATWWLEEDVVHVRFSITLPERREAGRTRQQGVFVFTGCLVRSRDCPVLEGRAERDGDDCKYTWYLVPPDPIRVLLSGVKLGLHDEDLPETHSVISFSAGRQTVRAGDLGGPLGLEGDFSDGRAMAVSAVDRLGEYEYISGPGVAAPMEREPAREEVWTLRETCSGSATDDDPVAAAASQSTGEPEDLKWAPLAILPPADGAAQAAAAEVLRLRQALLTHLLQVLLTHRPPDVMVSDLFTQPAEREDFFKCATLLADAALAFERCHVDFAGNPEVVRDALRVALEGLFAPFVTHQVSRVTVQSDHHYHPNEDWLFCLQIDRTSALRIRFDSKCKTEPDSDYLQFFKDELCRERLHELEKFSGEYPAGWPELRIPGDRCWMKFCSNSSKSEEHWGWKFSLDGVGLGGGDVGAVRFSAALQLLSAVACGASDAEPICLLASSALLTIAATLPETPEAVQALETMTVLLAGKQVRWSDNAWRTALALMSAAEVSNRRPLLAALVGLLSQQMVAVVHPLDIHKQAAPIALLDRVEPPDMGLLVVSRTTLVSFAPSGDSGRKAVHAFGFPVPPGSSAVPAFRVRVPTSSAEGAIVATGIAILGTDHDDETAADSKPARCSIADAIMCTLPARAVEASEELSIFAIGLESTQSGGCPLQDCLQAQDSSPRGPPRLLLTNFAGEQVGTADLPSSWFGTKEVVPVLQVEGFGGMVTLLPPPSQAERVDGPAARLARFQQAGRLISTCRQNSNRQGIESLPPAVVACAWALQDDEDKKGGAAADIEERLCAKCMRVSEGGPGLLDSHGSAQRLEVPGALAMELRFPRMELAKGHCLKVTYDAEGELPVLAMPAVASLIDGNITKYLLHGDYLYASLDNIDPDSTCVGTQQSHLPLPDGWEIAPSDYAIVGELIAKHPWGTHVMVCANGNSYSTTLHESGRRAGKLFNTSRLSVQRGSPTKYRPTANQFRILIRRPTPRPVGPAPLTEEDMRPDEHVVVAGKAIYVHGPVLLPARWDAQPRDEAADSEERRACQESGMRPVLCPGPWRWSLSPAHSVTVLLQQGGDVKLLKTTLGMLTDSEFEEVLGLMAVMGEGAIDPNAGWIRPEQFRLARVSGSWDAAQQQLKLRLDGADDLGTAVLAFSSSGEPKREQSGVSITGDVEHTRWSLRTIERDGRSSQSGSVSSVWVWPETHEASVQVEIVEDASHDLQLKVLNIHAKNRGGDAATSLFLEDGEWVEEVHGDRSLPGGKFRLQVRTNRGQELPWPGPPGPLPEAATGRFTLKAPAGCEVVGLQLPPNSDGTPELLLRPLDLVRANRSSMQRLPEALWDGSLEIKGAESLDVSCQLTSTGERGHFEAVLRGRCNSSTTSSSTTKDSTSEWVLKVDSFNVAGCVTASLTNMTRPGDPSYDMSGRCIVAEDQHMHLMLFGTVAGNPMRWVRLQLRSSNRTALDHHGTLYTDGPVLVFHAADGEGQTYTMHTSSYPWSRQVVAEDVLVAELRVEKLALGNDGSGLIVGVGEPRPGGGTAPLGAWPGDRTDRWLWRGDGSISHGDPAAVQKSDDWKFSAGDLVGIAVGPRGVTFLRNGEQVMAVPKQMRGLQGPLFSDQAPALIVGFSCDAVLRLASDMQYPHLTPAFRDAPADLSPEETPLPPPFGGDIWVEVTSTGTWYRQSPSMADTCPEEVVWPGGEVLVTEVVNGWLHVHPPAAGVGQGVSRSLWLPIEKPGVGRLFEQKDKLEVDSATAFEHTPEVTLDGTSGLELCREPSINLPTGRHPFTLEIWVKPESRQDAVILAWIRPGKLPNAFDELHLRSDGKVGCTGAGGLVGKNDICDDKWHHVAVQFDGRLIRLWIDFVPEARGECDTDVPVGIDESVGEQSFISLGHLNGAQRSFKGSLRKFRFWPDAMRPAQLKAYEREVVANAAVDVVFNALDTCADGKLKPEVIESVLGGTRPDLLRALRGHVAVPREHWQQYCRELRRDQGIDALMRFLRAFSHNIQQQLDRSIEAPEEWRGASAEALLAELRRKSEVHSWRVEARPVGLSNAMLEDLCDERLATFRRTLHAGEALLGGGRADDMIVELADQAALRKGTPDECWAELLAPGDWEKVPAALLKEAISRTKYGSSEPREQLQQSISFALASGKSLSSLLPAIFSARASEPGFEELVQEALQDGCSTTACAKLADFLLPSRTADAEKEPQGASDSVGSASASATAVPVTTESSPALSDAGNTNTVDETADQAVAAHADQPSVQSASADQPAASPAAGPAAAVGASAAAVSDASPVTYDSLLDVHIAASVSSAVAPAVAAAPAPGAAAAQNSASTARAEQSTGESEQAALVEESAQDSAQKALSLQSAVAELFYAVCSDAFYARFLVLREMNRCIAKDFLPLIDLRAPLDTTHSRLLTQAKSRLMGNLKYAKFQQVLVQTACTAEIASIVVNRRAALAFSSRGGRDWAVRSTLYGQVLRELLAKKALPQLFRQRWRAKAFKVSFKDEAAEETNSLYREVLDAFSRELHSKALPLLIPCPNARAEGSSFCASWILNPRAAMPHCILGFEFLGQLLGLAVRTGEALQLDVAPFTWKGIIGETRGRRDLQNIDRAAEECVAKMEAATASQDAGGVEAEGLFFAYPDVTGKEAELLDGGREVPVTSARTGEFAQLLLEQRLSCDRQQLRAVRRGLASVIPPQLLRLWTWQDLRDRVCGPPGINLEVLRQHTVYLNCSSSHDCVGFLWEVLEAFTCRQRQAFLRLVRGHGSLPTIEPWEHPFTLEVSANASDDAATRTDQDAQAPEAFPDTFELVLPHYSSLEVCRAWMLRAIATCVVEEESDADNRSPRIQSASASAEFHSATSVLEAD